MAGKFTFPMLCTLAFALCLGVHGGFGEDPPATPNQAEKQEEEKDAEELGTVDLIH